METKIRMLCPKCSWEATPASRWPCACGATFDVFDTCGRCPACGRVLHHVRCHGCGGSSMRLLWYHATGDPGSPDPEARERLARIERMIGF